MNKSYSKIRHIEKSNLILEKRNTKTSVDQLINKVLTEEPQDIVEKVVACFAAQKINIKFEEVPQSCSRIVAAVMKNKKPQFSDISDCTTFAGKKLGLEFFTKGKAIMECLQKSLK